MPLVQPRHHKLMSAAEALIIPRQLAKQQRQLAGAHRALMFDLQNEFVVAWRVHHLSVRYGAAILSASPATSLEYFR